MVYATFTMSKVVMTIQSKTFESLMKDIGYILAKYPVKVGDSFVLKMIPKDVFDFTLSVTKKNPKLKSSKSVKRNGGKR